MRFKQRCGKTGCVSFIGTAFGAGGRRGVGKLHQISKSFMVSLYVTVFSENHPQRPQRPVV